MESLIPLLLQFLPKQVQAIKLLQYVPDAVDTVKELTSFVQRTVAVLKEEAPLTEQQDAELDALIESMKSEPWWQPDAS